MQVALIGRFILVVEPAVRMKFSICYLTDKARQHALPFGGMWTNDNNSGAVVAPDHFLAFSRTSGNSIDHAIVVRSMTISIANAFLNVCHATFGAGWITHSCQSRSN